MSGMELLLRAAERTVAWSPSAVGGEGHDTVSGFGGPASAPAGPPSHLHQSLPPKKRTKLAPTADCERTNSAARPARPEQVGGRAGFAFAPGESGHVEPPVWISPDEWQNILATVTSKNGSNEANNKANRADEADGKTNAGRSKSKANKTGRGRKKRAAPLVKDVDGNDIGMGYFSANPPRNAVSPAASPPTAPVPPPPLNLQGADAREIGTARANPRPVEEILCRAYLSALPRPGADQ